MRRDSSRWPAPSFQYVPGCRNLGRALALAEDINYSEDKECFINDDNTKQNIKTLFEKIYDLFDIRKILLDNLNKNFNDDKKLLLIETLWEIVLSDGAIHDYESNLIRRLAGLLYISDVNSGNARKKIGRAHV